MTQAVLVLEDGRTWRGRAYGAVGRTVGEAVFATGNDRVTRKLSPTRPTTARWW
jgi:carbamoylphosphate synthase small subunit